VAPVDLRALVERAREDVPAARIDLHGDFATIGPRPVNPQLLAQHQSQDARRAGYAAYASGNLPPLSHASRPPSTRIPTTRRRATISVRSWCARIAPGMHCRPGKWTYHFNRARALAQLERWADAFAEYRSAAQIFPDDSVTQYNLGLALMRTRQCPDSMTALERAVALAPSEPSFLITLGSAYIAVEKTDRAKDAFQRFLTEAPNDQEVPRVKALLEALSLTT
jgi:tetratricopeptide (TPR) repeat protein